MGIKYLSSAAILKNKEAINYFKIIELEKKLFNTNENLNEEMSNSFDESISQKSESKNKETILKMENDSKSMKIKLLNVIFLILFSLSLRIIDYVNYLIIYILTYLFY